MGCCGAYGEAVQPTRVTKLVDDKFDGPLKNRECRDVFFLLLFLVFLGGMGYLTYRSASLGSPNHLLYGTDSWGNVCNQENDVIPGSNMSGQDTTGLRNLFYFKKDYLKAVSSGDPLASQSVTICVQSCPNVAITSDAELKAFAENPNGAKLCEYGLVVSSYSSGDASGTGQCPPLPVDQQTTVFNRCIPTSLLSALKRVGEFFSKFLSLFDANFGEKCAEDLTKTWPNIVYLCVFALGASVFALIFLRFFAGILVWLTVIVIALASLAGTGFCWYYYVEKRTTEWLVGAIAASVVALIILLILLVLRKRIKLVVQLFKEAGKAVACMPLLLVQPFVTLLILGGVTSGLVYIFLCMVTSRHPVVDSSTGYVNFIADDIMKYLYAYHFLGLIWITQFITGCERLAVSGAVAEWFFTRNKNELSWPIAVSIKRLIRYHLGSVALGSLLVAIVSLIRHTLSFIEGRLSGASNMIAKFFLKCMGCCLWCFEKFLKFLNSNAYIQIAINGYNFCKAAKQAFLLIVSNALRVAAINFVGDFVLFLTKASIVAVVAVVGIQVFKNEDGINYTWLPITLACIFSYLVANSFLGVYEKAIDAIFVCFVEDSDRNDGVDRPYFMSVGLMQLMSAKNPPTRNMNNG
ncbi:choline transporter-like protein 1 isoform X2 [Gigantopelta aegis]|uniref:choline transporter-like protein 1 isoform X2 n=1 Tax=Gigantopelta aegis TaxID=1735272 RepID=UPI001B8885CA|nr:choline transporter-like protein 1 isoform X2 [Gigantopelta aegis]